jgi:hypothetical protein
MRVAPGAATLVLPLAVLAAVVPARAGAGAGDAAPVIVTLDTAAGEIDVAVFSDRAPAFQPLGASLLSIFRYSCSSGFTQWSSHSKTV